VDFKLVEAEVLLQIHHCFFSHSIKTTCLTVISSYCLAASPARDVWGQQSHAEKRINYRKKRINYRKGMDMSELLAHHCIQCCHFSCSAARSSRFSHC